MTDSAADATDEDAILARLDGGGLGPEGIERKQHLSIYIALRRKLREIDMITALSAPPVFRGEGRKPVYADMIGLNDDICLGVLKNAARLPIEARCRAYVRFLKEAYDIAAADLHAWAEICLGDVAPAKQIEAPEDAPDVLATLVKAPAADAEAAS